VFGKDAVKSDEEFIAKIKETIGENYKRESDHFFEHHIEDYYVENTSINLPDNFLKTWLKTSSKGEVTDDVIEKEFDIYKRGLKWDLVKNRIAEDNKISVEADEVRAKAKDLIIAQFGGRAFAEQISDKLDGITDNYLQNENGQNFMKLYNQLRAEKILKLIREKITVQEKKVTVDEFKKLLKSINTECSNLSFKIFGRKIKVRFYIFSLNYNKSKRKATMVLFSLFWIKPFSFNRGCKVGISMKVSYDCSSKAL
jgi:trigger factor